MKLTTAFVLAGYLLAPFARADHQQLVDEDHRQLVDEFVQPLIDEGILVGCVVGIVDGDRQEVYGYGETKLGDDKRPTGETIYEIGSVTKAFTGTLLADMASRREVKLDAPLQDLLPDGVKLQEVESKPIRLVDVASQSSGLPRMPYNFAPKDPTNPYVDYTAANMFAFLGEHELRRPPGEYEYSNFGMGLLGHLLAQHAGKSYEELIIERICAPLAMNDTRIRLSDEQCSRLAPPYNGERSSEYNWDFAALAGAGALRSSMNDMLRLVRAALSEDARPVVAALHQAFETQFERPDGTAVGLGWQIAHDGVTRWHNGQTGGYSSVIYLNPPTQRGVVVLCNTPTELAWPLGEKILQAMSGLQPSPLPVRKSIAVDAQVLEHYVGAYALGPNEVIAVTLENGQSMAQLTGQKKWRLFPESETKFFYRIVDAQITFVKDDEGKVTKLILHQNGVDQKAVRVERK